MKQNYALSISFEICGVFNASALSRIEMTKMFTCTTSRSTNVQIPEVYFNLEWNFFALKLESQKQRQIITFVWHQCDQHHIIFKTDNS